MTISRELFLGILAMDAYNRGYEPGVSGLSDTDSTAIGVATVTDRERGETAQDAGFYAIAYTIGGGVDGIEAGTTVISYRGTDAPLGTNISGSDVWTGWSIALGFATASQAGLALQFYQDVVGQEVFEGRAGNVILTGHSLGGGLAQLAGALSGTDATLFDHAPFQTAAGLAYISEWVRRGFALEDILTGNFEGAPPFLSFSHMDAAYVTGEALQFGRVLGPATEIAEITAAVAAYNLAAAATVGTLLSSYSYGVEALLDYHALDSYGGPRLPVDLHSQALLVNLLFAEQEMAAGRLTEDWRATAPSLIDSMFETPIGQAVGFIEGPDATGQAGAADKMLRAIAYSALDSGERPFGDSAIRALFDDADELGRLYTADRADLLGATAPDGKTVKQAIAEIAVQYAGDLARSDAEGTVEKDGVLRLSEDGSKLSADLDPEKWAATFNTGATTGGEEKIVGLDTLVAALIAAMVAEGGAGRQDAIEASALRFKADSGETYRNVTWLEAAAGTAGVTIEEPDNARPTNPDGEEGDAFGNAILIGGDGADTITGSKGHDLILGGKGDDTYHAGDGTLPAGIDARGSIVFFGGDGDEDEADYSDLDKAIEIWFGAKIGAAEILPTSNRSVRTVMHEGGVLDVEAYSGTVAANDNGLPAQGRAA